MRLSRARFWLGDFGPWLEQGDKHYDLIVASGVLYHQKDPLRLIELIAQSADAVYFWTHLACETAMPPQDPRRAVFQTDCERTNFHGVSVRSWRRTYLQANRNPAFCGGMEDEHRWIEREDFLAALQAIGFTDIRTAHDEPDHKFGPALSVFARK